jgi:hypothetical protein
MSLRQTKPLNHDLSLHTQNRGYKLSPADGHGMTKYTTAPDVYDDQPWFLGQLPVEQNIVLQKGPACFASARG